MTATHAGAASTGPWLTNAAIVSRCLPQLRRAVDVGMTPGPARPLTPTTVQVAKPTVNHRAGDLVSFLGQQPGAHGPDWVLLDSLCKVPSTQSSGAPGSDPLPRSATVPDRSRPHLDLQLCNAAPDVTGETDSMLFGDNPNRVVASDVSQYAVRSQTWKGHAGLIVATDRNLGTLVECDLTAAQQYSRSVQVIVPRTSVRPLAYDNGYPHHPDRYWVAGATPSYGARQVVRARTIVVHPPGRRAQRFPVRARDVPGTRLGFYAFVVSFPRVTAPLGSKHTRVQVLGAHGTVLWAGRWDVGTEGH
ncbi:MAG TPA: hypothetical protein VF426_00325 [Marmoricola sp.]